MSTETTVQNLKINKLTKAQFDTITPSATEAYELTDLSSILDAKQDTLTSANAGNCIEITRSVLPSEYTRLEYIRATGTQYINTGYIPVVGDEIYIKYRFTTVGSDSSTFYCLLSAGASPNVNDYQLIMIEGKSTSIPAGGFFYKYFANGSATTLSFSPVVDTWYTANITSEGILTTGGVSVTSTPAGEISGADKNLYLFIRANMASPFLGDIAEMTITNNGTTKLNLIPTKRNSDNVLGMYDTVTDNFLTNSGTGSFTAGNVVSDETYINFVNNSGFITKAVDDLTNYYTKSQTYTQTEVQQLIAAIPNFSVEVVSSLPAEGEAMTLYLVPKTGTAPDIYEEYVWVTSSSSYELLGTTAVDLTGYLQTSDIATTVSASSTDTEVVSAKLYYDNRTDFYGTSTTAASTQTKVVTTSNDFALRTGVSIRVKFSNHSSSSSSPKLNVNSTGAISITSNGGTTLNKYAWANGEIVSFTYDGTYWIMEDGARADTTYWGYTRLQTSATSTSATYSLTPTSLNSLVQGMIEPYPVFSDSSTYAVGARVRYDFKAWECNTAITTAGSWNASKWTALDPIQTQIDSISTTIGDIETALNTINSGV